MNKYYITFGAKHKDKDGMTLKNCYTVVYAVSEEEARDKIMKSPQGSNWSTLYYSAQDAKVIENHLIYIPFAML
jgi:hypothetical protein